MTARPAFDDASAVVTGAASGIGAEIARQVARRGAFVLVTDLPGAGHEEVARRIVDDGGAARAMDVDVTATEDLRAAIDRVVDERGSLDLMFNNAGVAIFGEYDELTIEDGDRTLDVNLRGVVHGTTLAYRQMVTQGHGHIVTTASAAALVPVPLQAHYCATKQAVLGLNRTLRLEARDHGIGITTFCPAFVESGMFDNNTLRGSLDGVDPRGLVPIRPLATDVAVDRLLRGVAAGRSMVITPFYGRLGWWLERVSPALSERLHVASLDQMRRRATRARAADTHQAA